MRNNNQQVKLPFVIRAIRWFYPKFEAVLPGLAHQWAAKIFFTPIRYPLPAKEGAVGQEATREVLVHEGKALQTYAWGSGSQLAIVVHGWSGRGTQFFKFVPGLLAQGYKVVAFDAPAHHLSTGKRTNLIEVVKAMQTVVAHFGQPDFLIGHSLGGVVCLHALLEGLPTKRLVTIGSPAMGTRLMEDFAIRINGSKATAEYMLDYIKRNFGKDFEEMSGQHVVKQLELDEYLIIHDEDDDEVGVDHAHAYKAAYPTAQLHITKKLGHTRILRDQTVVDLAIDFANNKRQEEENWA